MLYNSLLRFIRLKAHLPLSEVCRLLHAEKDPIARTRLHAILLALQGKNRMEIAQALGYSTRGVSQVVQRWNEGGVEALKDRRHKNPGPKPKLTPEEQEKVLAALQAPPPDGGLWSGPKLRDWVERELGKRLSLSPIYRLLREMGFSLRVPRPQHKGADQEAQEGFKKTSSGGPEGPGGREEGEAFRL